MGTGQRDHYPVTFTAGDLLPYIVGVVTDSNDAAIDITLYTINFRLNRPTGGLLTKSGVLTDPTNGIFEIQWAAGDLVAGTDQEAEIELIDASSRPQTSRFLIDVVSELG